MVRWSPRRLTQHVTTSRTTNSIEHYTSQKTRQQLQKLESIKRTTAKSHSRETEAALPERSGLQQPRPIGAKIIAPRREADSRAV